MNILTALPSLFLLLFATALQFCLLPTTTPLAQQTNKSILYINSYHNGYQWSDGIMDGIRAGLAESKYTIDLQIEYMDAKKYNVSSVTNRLRLLYKEKFTKDQFDVIITSDDDAFHFALQYRDELFPDTPLVFCGVNDITTEELTAGNHTGIVENFDLNGTLDVALRLHPKKTKMVVIGDNSTTGVAIRHRIEQLVPNYRDRLTVDYWIQQDLKEVLRRVEHLPDDSFLFFIPYYQVIEGRYYTSEDVMAAISSHSKMPIYTSWEFLLGYGAVGGSMLSGFYHGQAAAQMSELILDGQDVNSLPVQFETHGINKFDYLVMKRLKIDEDMLPEDSTLINAPNPFYELPRELFWTIMVSVLLLLVTVIFLVFNMMARRQGELKIKNQLTFQETLIDTIPQLVSWKDTNSRYMGANRTFTNFFGLDELSEVVQKTTEGVVSDEKYVQWSINADVAVLAGEKELRRIRRKIIAPSGEISWLEVNKVPLRDQNGKINGILTTAENVTREHNLEHQLLQSQKMEAIGTLAGGIAHDFNNILTSIINSTELAIGDVDPASQTAKDLQRVLKAARRGGRVVKQIFAFSRPSQDGFRATDLSQVISEVIHLMEVSLPSNIEVRSYIAPGITTIHADPTQLHQAVMNLCTNGFHALRDQGGELVLRLEEVQLSGAEAVSLELLAGHYVRLTVADNGTGIPPEILDNIFDPFFSSKDKSEGTGLGLSVVHGIVKGHGGAIRVQSQLGEGSVFEIFLPNINAPDILAEQKREQLSAREGRILFVEDDIDQLLTAPRLLASFGYQVESVSDSEEAASMIAARPHHFDLMITDYDMPGMNGVALVKALQQWAPQLPVIMISGREEAITASANIAMVKKVLIKPYDKYELQLTIQSLLHGNTP